MALATEVITESQVRGLNRRGAGSTDIVGDDIAAGVPAEPDVAAARRWSASVRAIHEVVFVVDSAMASCSVSASARRRQFAQRIPLRIGLGLVELGVPGRLRTRGGDS